MELGGLGMKYLSLLLLWLVILAGTWTDVGQDLFGPTKVLREIKTEQSSEAPREPTFVKGVSNPNFIKAKDLLSKGDVKEAVMEYEAALSNKAWAQGNPKKWAEGAQTLMGIAEPTLAYELLSSFLSQGSVPENMHSTVMTWRLHAREWSNADPAKSLTQNISDAKALLDKAEDLQAKDPQRLVGLVLYLRSAAILNSILQSRDQDRNPEVLGLASRATEGLKSQPLTANHLVEESAD